MRKKSTTASPAKASKTRNQNQPARPARPKDKAGHTVELDALAHHLAEAFRIMDASESVPNYVYNAFADALNNLYNLVNDDDLVHSESHIRLYLAALAKKGRREVSKSNLKAVSDSKPEPLTCEQAERLARGIRDSVMEDEWLLGALLVFAREIIEHSFDPTHVETVATLLEDTLYPVTADGYRAQVAFVEAKRAEFLNAPEGECEVTTKKKRQPKDEETDRRAAFKLSRVLADPRTPYETRTALENALLEFSMSSHIHVYHPALARRAFQLMCDAKARRGHAKDKAKDRRELLALLDSIEEGGES